MRRCPNCQSPNPERALYCQRCGQGLAPIARRPFISLNELWSFEALKATVLPLLVLLSFRLSFGAWLNVGLQREEWRFAAFHLLHGLLLGTALAWARKERQAADWLRWCGLGLLGGALAEGFEVWYSYRHVMMGVAYDTMAWFGGAASAGEFPYEVLQTARLLGVLAPLGFLWLWAQKPRLGPQVLAFLALLLALYARAWVKGYALAWSALGAWLGWKYALLYAFSDLLVLYFWGPRNEPNP